MLHLRLSAPSPRAREIGISIERLDGVRRLFLVEAGGADTLLVSADVDPGIADSLISKLEEFDVPLEDYVLSRVDVVAPIPAQRTRIGRAETFAWIEVLGEARANSRPLARYLALMLVSGTIAAFGVLTANPILIVGAMAVSPDLLPVCASCVAIVGRRWSLARRSLGTLAIGLALVALIAIAVSATVNGLGLLVAGYKIGEGGLHGLAKADYSTFGVAAAAGIAAMLSFETRASAAVGVAISVTTIPASAYMGVALGLGEPAKALGALGVLGINVALLLLAGSLTLAAQRWAAARSGPQEAVEQPL